MSPAKAMIGYLQARIAELEAELAAHRIAKDTKNPAGYRVVPGGLYDEAVARYQKAEAELADVRQAFEMAMVDCGLADQKAEKAEASFKELNVERDVWMRKMHHGRTCHEAEAEVERLSRHDSAATAMLAFLATPEQWAEFQRVARGVNPSGDTLGRKGRDER